MPKRHGIINLERKIKTGLKSIGPLDADWAPMGPSLALIGIGIFFKFTIPHLLGHLFLKVPLVMSKHLVQVVLFVHVLQCATDKS